MNYMMRFCFDYDNKVSTSLTLHFSEKKQKYVIIWLFEYKTLQIGIMKSESVQLYLVVHMKYLESI